jgi:hypothetical protein
MDEKEKRDNEIKWGIERFQQLINPFGSSDVRAAIAELTDAGIKDPGNELSDILDSFMEETGIPMDDVDITAIAFEHLLQKAREEFDDIASIDIVDDHDFSVVGNYMCSSVDYTSEGMETLMIELSKLDTETLDKLFANDFTTWFFDSVEITREEIEELQTKKC